MNKGIHSREAELGHGFQRKPGVDHCHHGGNADGEIDRQTGEGQNQQQDENNNTGIHR